MKYNTFPRKEVIILSAIALAFFACVYHVIDICTDTEHRYEVSYANGRYTYSDYTDTFRLTPTSIVYRDENGVEIIRYGTFSVKKNPDYKK